MDEPIIVDTSVLVAALKSADGASRAILRRCLRSEAQPLIGQKLFFEYLDLFKRTDLFADCPIGPAERESLFYGFLATCTWVEVFFLWRPNLPDEGDNHVLELAVAGGAGTVVTYNTADFKGELHFPNVRVLTPSQYLHSKR